MSRSYKEYFDKLTCYNSRPALSPNGMSISKTSFPQSDAIISDHSLARNAPKLTYSNHISKFSGEKPPDPR